MEIKILGEHLVVTEAIGQYIKNKLAHLSAPEKLQQVEFRIGKEREFQYVRFHAVCPNHDEIVLNCHDGNLYRAIDKLMVKIHRSFVKNKERHNAHLLKLS